DCIGALQKGSTSRGTHVRDPSQFRAAASAPRTISHRRSNRGSPARGIATLFSLEQSCRGRVATMPARLHSLSMHPAQPRFYDHIRAFLRRNPPLVRTLAVPPRRRIYTVGDDDRRIYFVESGGVKLGVTSDHGRDCLLDVMVEGDLFGESCLTGSHERLETATTVSRTVLKAVAYEDIFPFLRHHSLYEPFMVELAARIS